MYVLACNHWNYYFQELTCDVELQHPESSKQQPLQFSFTLYDLDGHGRMTKDVSIHTYFPFHHYKFLTVRVDIAAYLGLLIQLTAHFCRQDIAGIVSTIYESIGKSVTVPHYGSKTIQVRLTVVPEDGRPRNPRDRRDGRRRRRKESATVHVAPPAECADNSEDDHHDRLSHDDDDSSKSSYSDRQPPQRPPPVLRQRPPHHRHARREPRERKHAKKRSGSLQRRELLEIIQANMEKNHLSFQASRYGINFIALLCLELW